MCTRVRFGHNCQYKNWIIWRYLPSTTEKLNEEMRKKMDAYSVSKWVKYIAHALRVVVYALSQSGKRRDCTKKNPKICANAFGLTESSARIIQLISTKWGEKKFNEINEKRQTPTLCRRKRFHSVGLERVYSHHYTCAYKCARVCFMHALFFDSM